MRPPKQSPNFNLSGFPISRHVFLLSRPIITPNFQHCHHFSTRPFLHRNHYLSRRTLSPPAPSILKLRERTLNPTSSPRTFPSNFRKRAPNLSNLSTSEGRKLIVTDHPAKHLGHIRTLKLYSPENQNAISWQLLLELQAEIKSVMRQRFLSKGRETAIYKTAPGPTRVLIISSLLHVFCAGADLKERAKMTTHETIRFLDTLRHTLNLLSHLHVPTIAAVGGHAHGGGLELALATDLRVFSTAAIVSLPETRLGIIPGAGGTHRLPLTIGRSRALEMVLTGRKLSGTEAYSWGLCERLVEAPPGKSWARLQHRIEPDETDQKKQERRELYVEGRDAVLDESLRLAHTICEGGPLAIGAALRAVKAGTESAENLEYNAVMGTQDRNRALAAFSKKQTPIFEGN